LTPVAAAMLVFPTPPFPANKITRVFFRFAISNYYKYNGLGRQSSLSRSFLNLVENTVVHEHNLLEKWGTH